MTGPVAAVRRWIVIHVTLALASSAGVRAQDPGMSNRPLGALNPAAAAPVDPIVEAGRALERRMFMRVNRDRAIHGRSPLAYREDLAEVARAHSRELARGEFFDHLSPTTGAPHDRIYRAGIPATRTGENIARDHSIEEAQVHLMQSPGHRENLLNPDFDHIGIGIVSRGGDLYITQKFIKALPQRDAGGTRDALFAAVNRMRRARRLRPLEIHPTVQQICQDVAESMNRAQNLDSTRLSHRLKTAGLDYLTIQVWAAVTADPEALLEQRFLERGRFDTVGIGLSPNRTATYGIGAFWTAVAVVDLSSR